MKTKRANLCGKRVKLARTMKEIHYVDLAAGMAVDCGLENMSQTMVSVIERGTRQISDIELVALSEVLESVLIGCCSVTKKPGKSNVTRSLLTFQNTLVDFPLSVAP